MKQVLIVVRSLHKGRGPDDTSGVRRVTLHEGADAAVAVGAALDIFNAKVGIGVADDFEISAHDPYSLERIPEAPVHQRGGEFGDLTRIANSLSELQSTAPAAVLLVGNPLDGCRLIGPFHEMTQESAVERANNYADLHLKHEEWWTKELEPPAPY